MIAAGLLLAGGAWGQVLRQVTSVSQNLALEHFGGEARMIKVSAFDVDPDDAVDQRPYVGLNVSNGPISAGNVAMVTFTLSGATFDQAATPTNLDQRAAGCAGARTSPSVVEASVSSGGARGDASVTYRVEVTDTGNTGLADGQAMCFWVPDLSATLATVSAPGVNPPVRGVNVTASIDTSGGTAVGSPFPGRISGMTDIDSDDSGTVEGAEVGNATNLDRTLFMAVPALTARLVRGDTGYVNIADRTKIATGGTPDPSVSGRDRTMGLRVGTLSVMLSSVDIWKLDGSGTLSDTALDSSLSGQINLSVSGRFQSGDKVVVGSGPTALIGTPSGPMAEVSVPIGTAALEIVYVPGGVDVLKPGAFAVGGAYLFNDRRNNNAMIMASTGLIRYAGVEVEAYAYGVVRGGGMDESFARITCEATANCQVFADCTDQDGMGYFGGPVMVEAGKTVIVNSDMIAETLEGGWASGRGRCDLHSTGELSFQHMLRSGTTLVNSSAVVGRGLDERAAGMTDDAIEAVQKVVDNICASTPGIQDLDTTMDGDQMTPCRTVAQ